MLTQAVADAFCPRVFIGGKRQRPEALRQAVDWLLSEDCARVVALAGYNPDWAMPRLADLVARHRAGEQLVTGSGAGHWVLGTFVTARQAA